MRFLVPLPERTQYRRNRPTTSLQQPHHFAKGPDLLVQIFGGLGQNNPVGPLVSLREWTLPLLE